MPLPGSLCAQHSRRRVDGNRVVAGLVMGSLMAVVVVFAMSLRAAKIDAQQEQAMVAQDLTRVQSAYGLSPTFHSQSFEEPAPKRWGTFEAL